MDMGLKLIAPGAVSPWQTKLVPSVGLGLEGWFVFDTDAARFGYNRAINKADAFVIGEPVAFATHGRFKGLTNFLQTRIAETDAMTLIAVCRAVAEPVDSDSGVMPVGNFAGTPITPGFTGNGYGTSLASQTATGFAGYSARDQGSGTIGSNPAQNLADRPTEWGIRVVRAQSGVPTMMLNATTGTVAFSASSADRVLADSLFRIGSATSGYKGEVDISAVAIYSTALSQDAIDKVVADMRKRTTRLGLSRV